MIGLGPHVSFSSVGELLIPTKRVQFQSRFDISQNPCERFLTSFAGSFESGSTSCLAWMSLLIFELSKTRIRKANTLQALSILEETYIALCSTIQIELESDADAYEEEVLECPSILSNGEGKQQNSQIDLSPEAIDDVDWFFGEPSSQTISTIPCREALICSEEMLIAERNSSHRDSFIKTMTNSWYAYGLQHAILDDFANVTVAHPELMPASFDTLALPMKLALLVASHLWKFGSKWCVPPPCHNIPRSFDAVKLYICLHF